MTRLSLPLLAAAGIAAASCRVAPAPSPVPGEPPALAAQAVDPARPLTAAEQRWVDSTMATLDLRAKVGQMVMVWLLGDYTNVADPTYQQMLGWVEKDRVGGVTMSLGTPIEVAAKLNELQRRSAIPMLVSADLEPALLRLESAVYTHYMLETGGATSFPPAMAIAATQRDSDAYDVGRIIAREGRASGIHVNFAPVVDVNN